MGVRPRIEIVSGGSERAIQQLLLEALGKTWMLTPGSRESELGLRPDPDIEGRWQIWTSSLEEESLDRLSRLFQFFCESTDWELLLDWDDTPYPPEGYQYRPRGHGAPVVLDLDDPQSPLWVL